MQQRVSIVTLGVADVSAARSFYERMGWRADLEVEETVFFRVGGIFLILWSRQKLAEDSGVTDGGGWGGVTLAHNVASTDEVDAVIEQARGAGARISVEPRDTFYGGYAGVFVDSDGHAWEIACNPGLVLDDEGAIGFPPRDGEGGSHGADA
ncbi:MAG TPA: VOC family protein [Actinomycetota bacterium]|nr:VOC family protein [Actinomycetota bacterium]